MKAAVATDRAPAPVGPYSVGVTTDHLVFVSGQGGFVSPGGRLIDGVEAQTEQALRNIEAVLHAAGAALADVVKSTVYLANLSDFAAMNAVYERMVPSPHPARTTVGCFLNASMLVEIDMIASRPNH